MPSPGSWRSRRRVLVAVAVLLLAGAGGTVAVLLHAPSNVSHPGVEFTSSTTTKPPPPPPKRKTVVNNFAWPWYGYDLGRTRLFPGETRLDPPLHQGWAFFEG